jgi:hypothetical protein
MMMMTGLLAIAFLRVIIKFESDEILSKNYIFYNLYGFFLKKKKKKKLFYFNKIFLNILRQKIIYDMNDCHAKQLCSN